MTRFKKAVLILLALIVLPVLLYSAYQIATLSDAEELIARIYRQQLDLILLSINQHAWDVANGWVNRVAAPPGGRPIEQFLERTPAIREVFWSDPELRTWHAIPDSGAAPVVLDSLRSRRELVDRLLRYDAQDYRKIEPILLGRGRDHRTVLVFVTGGQIRKITGLVLDDRRFVADVLAPKISESVGTEFLVGVFSEGERLFATDEVSRREIVQARDLWIFPHVSVGIRMRGQSLDEILRQRLWRNVGLVLGLDLLLLAGAWLVYRGINREIDLVRLRSDFVSTVSHELRTPLALIRMYAETLEMGRIDDPVKQKEYLATILSETERLTRLVNDVLSVSRTDAGKRKLAPVDLNAVVRDVLKTYADRLASAGFFPEVAYAESLSPVMADREAVAEALINLVDNAMKYSPDRKHLRIRTGEDGKRVYIDVEDQGTGIAPEHHRKVFEPFFRVTEGLVHSTKGTGLGLALVKRIMESHGGEVVLRSVPGKGSTFRLLFRRALS